ncbi:hypothetical protein YC2023_027358 [Brassica napus]
MEFCPTCGNLLRYGQSQFFCSACPYIARIERQVEIKKKQLLVKKSIDPVVKKDDIPKGPETEGCEHKRVLRDTEEEVVVVVEGDVVVVTGEVLLVVDLMVTDLL